MKPKKNINHELLTFSSIHFLNCAFVQDIGTIGSFSILLVVGTRTRSSSAYRRVFLLGPTSARLGFRQAMTTVLLTRLPAGSNTCFKTFVNALCRKGTYGFFCFDIGALEGLRASASTLPRMQSFSTDKLTFISRVSRMRSAPC